MYPLTEAPVLLTRAATGLIRGRVSPFGGAEEQLCSPAVCAAPILRLKSENCAVESVEQLSRSAFSSLHELFLVCASADVYFSWHVLAGAEPPISHIFIG